MDKGFIDILQKLTAEQGKEALLNPVKCKAFLADYTKGEYKKESRLLLQALETGVQKEIITTQELEICKKQQARLLQDEYFLAAEIASDVVDTLVLFLRGETPKTLPQTPQIITQLSPSPTPIVQTPSPNKVTPHQEEDHTTHNIIIFIGVTLLLILIIKFVNYETNTKKITYDVNAYTSDTNTYTPSDVNTHTAYDSESDFEVDWDTNVKGGVKITKYVGAKWDVRIPPNIQDYPVTGIGNGAFATWTIKSVTIPDSVTKIGWEVFAGSGLISVNIPDSVTEIEAGAFGGTNLTSITIPDSVTIIRNSAFQGCVNLTKVTIGNSVTSIDDYTFISCTSLTSITIPDSVKSINRFAFHACTSLTNVTIGNNVISIGDMAFRYCTSLTSVTFQGKISSKNFSDNFPFPGDLRDKYLAGGIGTYKRFFTNTTWLKQ